MTETHKRPRECSAIIPRSILELAHRVARVIAAGRIGEYMAQNQDVVQRMWNERRPFVKRVWRPNWMTTPRSNAGRLLTVYGGGREEDDETKKMVLAWRFLPLLFEMRTGYICAVSVRTGCPRHQGDCNRSCHWEPDRTYVIRDINVSPPLHGQVYHPLHGQMMYRVVIGVEPRV